MGEHQSFKVSVQFNTLQYEVSTVYQKRSQHSPDEEMLCLNTKHHRIMGFYLIAKWTSVILTRLKLYEFYRSAT